MFKYVLPEDVGISSERVWNYLKTLDVKKHGTIKVQFVNIHCKFLTYDIKI